MILLRQLAPGGALCLGTLARGPKLLRFEHESADMGDDFPQRYNHQAIAPATQIREGEGREPLYQAARQGGTAVERSEFWQSA